MKNPLKNVSKKKKTLIIIGGIVVICIIVSFIKPKSDASQGVLVSAGTVSRGNLSQTISIKSTVEGSDSANVFSAANYRINSVTVKEGDVVKEGQTIGIVEAMKLMNEVNAGCSGIVEAIVAENEQMVEYGQPLIKIRREQE